MARTPTKKHTRHEIHGKIRLRVIQLDITKDAHHLFPTEPDVKLTLLVQRQKTTRTPRLREDHHLITKSTSSLHHMKSNVLLTSSTCLTTCVRCSDMQTLTSRTFAPVQIVPTLMKWNIAPAQTPFRHSRSESTHP